MKGSLGELILPYDLEMNSPVHKDLAENNHQQLLTHLRLKG